MGRLYRFSPIKSESQLFEAINYIHNECYKLCKQSLGYFLPTSGNIGVFCHYDNEYEFLTGIQKKLTEAPNNPNQKYLRLKKPIIIPAKDSVPQTSYTHLYIRKPDPYRSHVGDVDFLMNPDDYKELKDQVLEGKIKDARSAVHPAHDMIEFYNPDSDVLAYAGDHHLL